MAVSENVANTLQRLISLLITLPITFHKTSTASGYGTIVTNVSSARSCFRLIDSYTYKVNRDGFQYFTHNNETLFTTVLKTTMAMMSKATKRTVRLIPVEN